VAHDFNNLLQAVLGAADVLADRPELAPSAREEVALILGAARRGANLVGQLLAFSRQQTLQPRIVAVNAAVRDLAPLLRRSLGEQVRLGLVLDDLERSVRIDPGQLDQVLVNLAVNARDAMPEGGALTLRTGRLALLAPRTGGLETVPPGRYVAIEVQDTGTGIPTEVLPRIFEPFFTTRGERGSGLGLATVLGIVRQSGGFLEVETAAGRGTIFRILLPREREAAQPVGPAVPAPEPVAPAISATTPTGKATGRGRILLAEDEEAVRRLAVGRLTKQGWEVLAAETGEAALALLGDGTVDAIVTDMMMPGMDGVALVGEVRRRLARPNLPALITSGYADVALHDAIATAATAFLSKPYSLRDLADRVAALVPPPEVVAPAST
jgi:two-component system cell cycle sensor histidine kinase/response regulator CckA